MIGVVPLLIWMFIFFLCWCAYTLFKFIGYWLGYFEDPKKQTIISGIKFKKKEVVEEEKETTWSFLHWIIGTIIFCVCFDYVFGIDLIDALFKTISELLENR